MGDKIARDGYFWGIFVLILCQMSTMNESTTPPRRTPSPSSVGNAIKKWRNVLYVSPRPPPTTPDKNHPPENGLSYFSVNRYLPPFFTIFGGSLACRPLPSGEMPTLVKMF